MRLAVTGSDHYFTPRPGSEGSERRIRLRLAGREVVATVSGGVFSPGGLDRGTAVLLDHVPDPPRSGNLLDLGCGWGPIALTMGLLAPEATVWAVDVNERAVALTRTNAAALGLERVRVRTPQEVPGEITFDAIWSNPPIRIGKAALHEMLLTWLPRLSRGGSAHLVAQRNLGSDSLQRWLSERLPPPEYAVARAASSKGYRVLRVDRL